MGAITFGGLVSGLDTGSMIDKLVSLERAPADVLAKKQTDLNTKKSIVGSLSSAVAALATAVRGLDLDSEIKPLAVTTSDSHVSMAVSSGATAGVHDFRVTSLAAAPVFQSNTFSSATTAGVVGDGGVDITVGGNTKSVTWTATDSLTDVADKINAANGGVSASVVDVGGGQFRLAVRATASGTAAAPTFADTGTGNLGLANVANRVIPASDAVVSVDGIQITRSTNVISDALTGVTLTLNAPHGATDPNSKSTVALDTKALTDKVKSVVTAYNSINASLHIQLDYTGTTKGTNTLFGDSALRQLQQQLGSVLSSEYGGSNLGVLGISRDRSGAMTLDESKLTAAIGADPDAVKKIFITGGFASTVGSLADTYTQSGTGIFATKSDALTTQFKSLQDQIDRVNKNADNLQTRLEAQFSALEKAMSDLQSQSNQLLSMLKTSS